MKTARFSILSVALMLLLMLAFVPSRTRAEADNKPLPFDPSEESVYEAEFSRAIFRGINIATLRFTASREAQSAANKENAGNLRFTAEAESKGLFPKLFSGLRIRQRVESIVDAGTFNALRTIKLDEQGNRRRSSEAVFDLRLRRVTWTEKNLNDPTSQPRVVTSDFQGIVQDLASVFYFVRTQPLTPGRRFEVLVSDSGQVYRLPIQVAGKKKMKTILGEVETVQVEPELFGEDRLLRGQGQMTIWFTTDPRQIPVRAQLKHELGTVNISLKRYSNPSMSEAK